MRDLASFATFGELLSYLRHSAGLSQAALAARTGFSQALISRLEQDERLPDRIVLQNRFVPALGIASQPEIVALLLELASAPRRAQAPGRAIGKDQVPASPPALQYGAYELPILLTPLFGREVELSEIKRLLASADMRLLTLSGLGGSGKTRLALQACSDAGGVFDDGVTFVSLASLISPDMVPSAIAAALGLHEAAGVSIAQTLVCHLQSRRLLLVLDNFEHLLPAAPLIGNLLAACPGLKALVTSREQLCLQGEYIYRVQPLGLPDLQHLPPVDVLQNVPSVALFVHRSQAVRPDFKLSAQNAAIVAEMVVRLDGLPLAIELAAAQTRYMASEVLLARIGGGRSKQSRALHMLVVGPRDVPARHQTLRNAIEWSYDLLDPVERVIFRRLALFPSCFVLSAGEAVCAGVIGSLADGSGPSMPVSAFDGIEALADKNLIRLVGVDDEADQRYFGMPSVIREFALEIPGADLEARSGFVRYYSGLAEQARNAWPTPDQRRWLQWLKSEDDNVRQALAWSLAEDVAPEMVHSGGAIVLGLDRYWRQMVRVAETRTWIEKAVALPSGLQSEQRARLYAMAGFYAMLAGAEPACVMEYHEQSLALARDIEDEGLLVDLLEPYAIDAAKARFNDLAKRLAAEAIALERRCAGMSPRLAGLSNILATVHYDLAEYDEALAVLEDVVGIFRQSDTPQQLAAVLANMSTIARAKGDFERDAACLCEAWKIARASGDTMQGLVLASAVAERVHLLGHARLSATLHSGEQALAERLGLAFPPAYRREFDARLAELHSQLDAAAFSAAWSAGQELTLEDIMQLGLTPEN